MEADSVLSDAWTRATALMAADNPSVIAMTDALGRAQMHLGHYAESDSLLQVAYSVRLERNGPDHRLTRETATNIRDLYVAWGKPLPDL